MNISDIKAALFSPRSQAEDLPIHFTACCRFLNCTSASEASNLYEHSDKTYRTTAALGFELVTGKTNSSLRTLFLEGVQQLSGRVLFGSGKVPTFEMDGVALLGVALGYRASDATSEQFEWLLNCLSKSLAMVQINEWQLNLMRMARNLLEGANAEIDPVLQVAVSEALEIGIDEQLRQSAWTIVTTDFDEVDPIRRAALQGTFEVCVSALSRLPVAGAGVSEVIEILEGISHSMGRWTYEARPRVKGVPLQKWEIDHEYHVQNLLWTVLRPIFQDLIDEETLKKVGHTSSRYDLGIPSLHLVIEVKFLRNRGQSALKSITDQIAADHTLYLREGTGFSKMIAFIWDEQRQTEEYQTLKSGLESLSGIERVVIVPRPAKMDR